MCNNIYIMCTSYKIEDNIYIGIINIHPPCNSVLFIYALYILCTENIQVVINNNNNNITRFV